MRSLSLGKRKPTHDNRDLLFENYVTGTLPTIPAHFGHESLISDWGMLGNDELGCCVESGAAHETMLWNKEAGKDISFSKGSVLHDYAAITGFNPNTGVGDNGTNVRDALKYRAKTGILDASGVRHKIGAYIALEPGNLQHLYAAMYIFGAVGIGIEFPGSAMDQFNQGKPWSVVHGAQIEGGHYIPLIARRTRLVVVTWGKVQQMTTGFYTKYCDESWAILSTEFLTNGRSPEGFDLTALKADLNLVK